MEWHSCRWKHWGKVFQDLEVDDPTRTTSRSSSRKWWGNWMEKVVASVLSRSPWRTEMDEAIVDRLSEEWKWQRKDFSVAWTPTETFCTWAPSKAILEETKLIFHCRTMLKSRAVGLSVFITLALSIIATMLFNQVWTFLTWHNHDRYFTELDGKCTRTQYIGSTWEVPKKKDHHSGKLDPMLSSFVTLYRPTVLKRRYIPKLKKFFIRRLIIYRRVCHQKLCWGMLGKFNFRIQGVSNAAVEPDEDNRTRLIRRLVHQVMHHPNKDAWIADLQNNRPFHPLSKESKQMIPTMGNVECFELCVISLKARCIYCLKCWTEGLVSVPVAHAWFPHNLPENWKGIHSTDCHSPSSCLRKAHKNKFDSIFNASSSGHWSKYILKNRMRWGVFANTLIKLHKKTIHTSLFGEKKRRCEKGWKLCLYTQGPVGPMKSRPDYPEAVLRISEIKREAEGALYDIIPAIRPSLQVQLRPG